MENPPLFVGVDVGASRTKVAVLDADRRLWGWAIDKSGTNFTETADRCLQTALEMAGAGFEVVVKTVSAKMSPIPTKREPRSVATERGVIIISPLPSR